MTTVASRLTHVPRPQNGPGTVRCADSPAYNVAQWPICLNEAVRCDNATLNVTAEIDVPTIRRLAECNIPKAWQNSASDQRRVGTSVDPRRAGGPGQLSPARHAGGGCVCVCVAPVFHTAAD